MFSSSSFTFTFSHFGSGLSDQYRLHRDIYTSLHLQMTPIDEEVKPHTIWDFIPYVVKAGFSGSDVAIISAYTAQVATYRYALYSFIDWCLQQDRGSDVYRLSAQLSHIEVFAVDKTQGDQKEAIHPFHHHVDRSGVSRMRQPVSFLANGHARARLPIIGRFPNWTRANSRATHVEWE
ncbi:hypothetical protein BM1_00121 [Bipolaris maydis]|nr:hypothetical protein BM1_00121 [Bipolaris maydis]